MLAGLLFAEHEALDRPGSLIATLPFGGGTVIEYQARLLAAAGAAQIIVAVGRLTPELLGALGRVAKRGIVVDTIRTAGEAAAKLHPLSTIVMLADGLITTQALVDDFAGGAFTGTDRDALLVLPAEAAGPDHERLGGQLAWAGVARIDPRRIGEVAELPHDYDLQSSILRLAEQAQAKHLPLAPEALRDGHGIEHSAAAFTARSRVVLAATVADRRDWFDVAILGPLARVIAPRLLDRHVATGIVVGTGGTLGVAGIAASAFGQVAAGLVAAFVGVLALGIGRVLAALRDEEPLAVAGRIGMLAVPAAAVAATGIALVATSSAGLLAIGALAFAGLGERAIRRDRRQRWWGGAPAYLLIAAAGAVIGWPVAGLGCAAVYAGVTLAAALESLREQP